MKRKNMKKRIKRVILISILLSIMFFTAILSFSAARAARSQGYLMAAVISNMASQEIFSQEIMDSLYIVDFNNLKGLSFGAEMLTKRIEAFEGKVLNSYLISNDAKNGMIFPEGIDPGFLSSFKPLRFNGITNGPFTIGEIAQIRVSIGEAEIYTSKHWGSSIFQNTYAGRPVYPLVTVLTHFFNIEAVCNVPKSPSEALPGENGLPFAKVVVRLDPGFLVSYYLFMLLGVVVSAVLALIISGFFAGILSKSVSLPFSVLEGKLRSLTKEDYETTLHSQIVIKKRPITEIESIAQSTNTIIRKMHEYNEIQLSQRKQLEDQKNELESQKEDLLESRQMIQEAQSQLVQSQNLASIGQLTAAISHEINEPLDRIEHGVSSQNELAVRLTEIDSIRNDPESLNLVNQLIEAGNLNSTAFGRISSIIKSLKNFSRLDLAETEPTDINANLQSVVLLTSNLWKRRIVIHGDYGDIPSVTSYSGLISQVFMNVIVNAIHAIPDKGDIYIKTWDDGEFVFISVKDTGTGIPENIRPFIFDTGFTTKKCGSGSGLGLAISKDIIKKHNGKIEVNSKPGEGAEFVITLPIHSRKMQMVI